VARPIKNHKFLVLVSTGSPLINVEPGYELLVQKAPTSTKLKGVSGEAHGIFGPFWYNSRVVYERATVAM
jgi:hypothetical protein